MNSEAADIDASFSLLEAKAQESADLERSPRAEVSVHIPEPELKAGSGDDKQKQMSPAPTTGTSAYAENLLDRLQWSCRERQDLKGFADIHSLFENAQKKEMPFVFHDHSGPLVLEDKIIDPDSWEPAWKPGEKEESKQHKYVGPEKLHLFKANGIYRGKFETDAGGSTTFEGCGLWVSVSSSQGQGAKKGGHFVTILWGNWEGKALAGSMLHAFMPEIGENDFQRCVGFSYNGSFSLEKCDKGADKKGSQSKSQPWQELMFDHPVQDSKSHGQSKTAIFREFEFAVPKVYQNQDKLSQVWVELFFATLLDDGLERKESRDFERHKQILRSCKNQDGFIEFLRSNYIGTGLQYFVPRIVEGMHARCKVDFIIRLNHNYSCFPLLCHICKY
jgi:hypothetical protein